MKYITLSVFAAVGVPVCWRGAACRLLSSDPLQLCVCYTAWRSALCNRTGRCDPDIVSVGRQVGDKEKLPWIGRLLGSTGLPLVRENFMKGVHHCIIIDAQVMNSANDTDLLILYRWFQEDMVLGELLLVVHVVFVLCLGKLKYKCTVYIFVNSKFWTCGFHKGFCGIIVFFFLVKFTHCLLTHVQH